MAGEIYIKNRQAYFDYAIEDKLNVGIILTGSEIKSVRLSKVSFNDSYCLFRKGELWVKSLYIGEYANAGYAGHDPVRDRKLLATRRELNKWENKTKEKGYSIVPVAMFITESGLAKVEIALAKGKKVHDKRESIKSRDVEREIRRFIK